MRRTSFKDLAIDYRIVYKKLEERNLCRLSGYVGFWLTHLLEQA
jgi:hypothetical protein